MHKFVIFVLTGATALALPLRAATVETYTQPLGVSIVEVPQGEAIVANPYLAPAVCQTTVSSLSGTTVTLAASTVPDVVTKPHYLEILSGTLAGTTISILSATANSVTLRQEATGLAAGDHVRIRPHFTLASTFAHTTLPDTLPEVTLFNEDWVRDTYTYSASQGWYDDEGNADDLIVFPGEGFLFNCASANTLMFIGEVSDSPIKVPGPTHTVILLGTLNPAVGVSLSHLGFVTAFKDGDSLNMYKTAETGKLTADKEFLFFEDWGFYDFSLNEQNDYAIEPLQAAMILRGPHQTTFTLPAAFSGSAL